MKCIYLIALEITAITLLTLFIPLKFVILIGTIIIATMFIFNEKKEKILLIIPIIFLLKTSLTLNFVHYKIGDNIRIETQIHQGYGKIIKLNGKIPISPSYVQLSQTPDGKYNLLGTINNLNTKYKNIYYRVEVIDSKEIPKNYIENYFVKKSNSLLKNSSFNLQKLFKATILGENYRLSKEIKEKFSYIGISHLIAISGFHIGLIIMIANWIMRKIPFSKRSKNIILLIFLTLYYIGINHSPSLTRAYIMATIYLLGNIFYENSDLMKSLTLAYIITLFINPMEIISLSFKLSYGAVFIIAGVYPFLITAFKIKNNKYIKGILLIFILQIFLAPILINEFGTIQLLSFLSNIIIVPIGSLFITLSFIALLIENFSLGFLIIPFVKFSYYLFMKGVDIFSKIPYMSISFSKGYQSTLFYFYYFGFLIFILYIYGKKEKTTDEKIFKRTKICQ